MVGLENQAIFERHLEPAVDRLDAERDRERAVAENRLHHFSCHVHQLRCRRQLVDETDSVRLGRIDRLAGHEELHRAPLADEAREALAPSVPGQNAELALGLTEFGEV